MTAFTLDTVSYLKQESKRRESEISKNHASRMHRAISWLECAAESGSIDIEFISLWISFSACFAVDTQGDHPLAEHQEFQSFVDKLIAKDIDKKLYSCLWEEYSGHVKALIRNPYVFHEFWVSSRNGDDLWEDAFNQSSLKALNALSRQRVPDLFMIVLDRLFVLRNQLVYGGATYKGKVNRQQVEDGAGLLGNIMPIVIEIMLANDDSDWGDIAYPVINP